MTEIINKSGEIIEINTEEGGEDAKPGRLPNGYFAAGNKIAKGNLVAQRTRAYRKALIRAVTPEMLGKVCQSMVLAAIKGDVAAGKLIMALTCWPRVIEINEQIKVSSDDALAKLSRLLTAHGITKPEDGGTK